MSIQSEINRLNTNVSNALAAISEKGVTVPSDSGSDELAELIRQISASTTVFAIINATYPAGATVTCTKGSTTLTAPDTSGSWMIVVPEAGTWTVTVTDGENTKSQSVNITTQGQVERVVLSFALYIYNEGLVDGYTFGIAKDEGTARITQNSNSMTVYVGSYIAFGVYSNQKIDVTDYSTLNIEFTSGSMSLMTGRNKFGLNSSTGYQDSGWAAQTSFNNFSGANTLSVDISSVTGSYYVRMRGLTNNGGSFNVTISDIWFE